MSAPEMPGPDAGPPADVDPFSPPGVAWRAVSPRLATVRRIGELITWAVVAVALAVVTWLTGWTPLLAALVLPIAGAVWGWWLIGRQVAAIGYAEREQELLVRRGVMFRKLVVVPYGRLQFVDVDAGPIARRYGLASVQLHTASAGSDAAIPGVPAAEAARLRDRLAERGEAQLAGL